MPAPRLRGGFVRLSPENIPPDEIRRAVSLKHYSKYGEEIALENMPPVNLVIAGSVAVSSGVPVRGKGEGYSDWNTEYCVTSARQDIPTATLVHPLQVVHIRRGISYGRIRSAHRLHRNARRSH